MGTQRPQKVTAFSLIPRWFSPEVLNAGGTTEANPRPGVATTLDPRSLVLPVVSGGQSRSLTIRANGAGMPGRDPAKSARVLWTDSLINPERGWDHYGILVDRRVLGSVAAGAEERAQQLVALPDGRRVVAVYAEQGGSSSIRSRTLNGDVDGELVWGSEVVAYAALGAVRDLCACALPSGRVVVLYRDGGLGQWDMIYSDDAGATWAVYADNVGGTDARWTDATGGNRARMALVGDALLMVRSTASGTLQAVSRTLGSSWETVYSGAAVLTSPDVLALADGSAAVLGRDAATTEPTIWLLGQPDESIAAISGTVVLAASATDLTGWVEPDGTVWAAVTQTSAGRFRVSYDNGRTWAIPGVPDLVWHQTTAAGSYPRAASSAPLCGRAVIAATALDAAGTEGRALAAYVLGGWSTIESRACQDGIVMRTYLPHDLPASQGWTAGGTGTQTITDAGLSLTTTAVRDYTIAIGTSDTDIVAQFSTRVSGGSPAVGFDDHAVVIISGNGANRWTGRIRFSASQIRILNGTTEIATINWDNQTTFSVVRAEYRASDKLFRAWVQRAGSTTWTLIGSGTLSSAASAAAGEVKWGKVGSFSNSCEWRYFWFQKPASWLSNTTTATKLGRALPPRGGALVIPGAGSTTQAARLSATGGPAYYAQEWAIVPTGDRPARAIMPQIQPSPRRGHESAGNTEQVWIWGIDGALSTFRLPEYLCIAVARCNWRLAYFETWDGSTWTTRGTIDLAVGFVNVDATASGVSLRPAAGTSGGRYVQRGELVGGSVDFGAGEVREIVRCKEGRWNAAAGHRHAAVDVAVAPTVPGAVQVTIRHHSGYLMLLDLSLSVRAVRLRIPAQATASGTLRTGTVHIGEVVAAGYSWGWGQVRARELSADRSESDDLVSRVRQRGPTRREWTVDWTDGADATGWRQDASPDWYGPTVAPSEPLATIGDMSALEALPDETRSGELPIVAISWVPGTSGVTVTDPTAWIYGRLASAPEVSMVVGEEGVDELVRVGSVVVEEVP